jgi:hypothetical protein
MKKIFSHLVLAALSFACSVSSLLATPTPAPTFTNTPTTAPSSTPTIPTSTFTNTPTLVGVKTRTPTPEFTSTAAFATPVILVTPNTPTPSPQMKGFISVNVSAKEFYKAGECLPTSVKFTAQAIDTVATAHVVLFVRFKSKQSDVTSEWTSIKMETIGAGTFVHDLTAEEMKGGLTFQNPWIQYQFVATQANTRELGRTDIFSERLTLLECRPTPTPTLSPTPTVLKP